MAVLLGVDVGGSTISAGLVTDAGEVLVTVATPSHRDGPGSAADTLNQIRLRFPTQEEAEAYAKGKGLEYTVVEPQERSPKSKSYAENFRYDRVR